MGQPLDTSSHFFTNSAASVFLFIMLHVVQQPHTLPVVYGAVDTIHADEHPTHEAAACAPLLLERIDPRLGDFEDKVAPPCFVLECVTRHGPKGLCCHETMSKRQRSKKRAFVRQGTLHTAQSTAPRAPHASPSYYASSKYDELLVENTRLDMGLL